MNEQLVLVKKIHTKATQTSELSGTISTSFNLKEIVEIRHELEHTRVVMGNNVIAFFGGLKVKAYCINSENNSLFVGERTFPFKGFLTRESGQSSKKFVVSSNSKVLDIIVENVDCNKIEIAGVVLTEIKVYYEQEIKLKDGLFEEAPHEEVHSAYPQPAKEKSDSRPKQVQEPKSHNFNFLDMINKTRKDGFKDLHTHEEQAQNLDEISVDVNDGNNQDFTIILE